jgi:cellulose synthase/poly-beta-1,6-N-acetylglucosamine synthase-like glycosyltransferase
MYGIYVLSTLWLLMTAFAQLHLLSLARKKRRETNKQKLTEFPFITVQVPVYNEKYVVEELIDSLALLDYPKQLFEIQVLDDSTDETSLHIDQKVKELRQKGFDISVIRRGNRKEFKAGALQHGLAYAKGELIAIFDADFRPPQSFLQALLPYFSHPEIGLVQARWGHLNREQNFLTRIQTYLLDMHFLVEQAGRYNADYFINFCGTAGIWRKQCILEAGGWDGSVLSEDLDLSYRAQLKGWKIIYDQNIEVPAQLPAVIEAFKIQQFRWTKGIAQTAKKTLHRIWSLPIPITKKLHSIFHLLGSFTFVCLFLNALLSIPLLLMRNQYPEFVQLTNYTAIGALNLVALTYLYYSSSSTPKNKTGHFLKNYPLFVVVYLAMSAQNAVAVIQGLTGIKSAFIRTPKFKGANIHNKYISRQVNWITILEMSMFLYFLYGIGLSIYLDDYFLMLFFLMIIWGLAILLYHSLSSMQLKNFLNLRLQFRQA